MATVCTDFKIGLTAVGNLVPLNYRGIPWPDAWTYTPYSRIEICGNGTVKGYGFPTASWTWEVMSQWQLNQLLRLFTADTDASVSLYIRTALDTGGTREFGNFSAVMQRPVDGSGKTMMSGSMLPVYNNVTVTFRVLVAA